MAARYLSTALLFAFGLLFALRGDAQQTPSTVALVETWPDGKINYELTSSRRAVMWTPSFPRVEGFTLPEGSRPVFAVQFARILVGHDIKVDVSVLLGSAEPPGVPVTTVLVTPGTHVVIDGLTKFGVRPVTLSMADVAPLTPYLPTVESVSPSIEIADVELLVAPYPGYRVTLRNLSSKGVSNVHVQTYRGQEKALSALKRSDDGRPMMMPGSTYAFDINLTSGPGNAETTQTWSPRPLDLIELDAIRWEDGAYSGVPPFPHVDPAIEAASGRRLQLRRVLDALNKALTETSSDVLATARQRIEHLPDSEPDQVEAARIAMHSIKAIVRDDLGRFRRTNALVSDNETRDWLTMLVKRYESWLVRISPP